MMILLLYYIEDLVCLGKLCKTITEMECKPHLSSPEKNIVTELDILEVCTYSVGRKNKL